MPLYVKWDYKPQVDNSEMKGVVSKVEGWAQSGFGVIVDGQTIATRHFLPATEQEYLEYIKQKQ